MAHRPQPSFSGDDLCSPCLTWCYGKPIPRGSSLLRTGERWRAPPPLLSPSLLPTFISGCSLFRPVSRFGCDITAHFSDLVGNPHLTRQELGLIDKVVWLLHQPRKSLPTPPHCSGGWKFLMKVSIHKPEAVSVGTPGPGLWHSRAKHRRALSWGQNQWIESNPYYLWVMMICLSVWEMLCCVCVKERERFILNLAHESKGSVRPKIQGWQAGWRLGEGLMLQTESKGGLDNSVASLTLFSLRFRKSWVYHHFHIAKFFKGLCVWLFLCSYC